VTEMSVRKCVNEPVNRWGGVVREGTYHMGTCLEGGFVRGHLFGGGVCPHTGENIAKTGIYSS